ncbi:hypothetical protein BDZ94DRAFT_692 [Collybia nuda]|uniref:Ubiquitin-like protease family profile domain-containing protein n=1 Tax=Collybia nuda TaxID=64659 RepID=A0A9P5YGH4_9AGAR|nr:hypothetical protein BDZ94DRAFT_692 [Collybia nuda]
MGRDTKRRRLQAELDTLLGGEETAPLLESTPNCDVDDNSPPVGLEALPFQDAPVEDDATTPRTRRTLPDSSGINLYDRWKGVLPRLVDALLTFVSVSTGQIIDSPTSLQTTCSSIGCPRKTNTILCLFQNHFQKIDAVSCQCQDILTVLVTNGLFPTAPTYPRMAVSIFLLDFYSALFERSCDAINALASALNTFYKRRGFVPINHKGEPMPDAFRRGLGYAVQWYDNLKTSLSKRVEKAVQIADALVQEFNCPPDSAVSAPPEAPSSEGLPGLTRGECARILVQRCPACFGGTWFGRPLDEGGDIHAGPDGNFNHRHITSAGDCPAFYEPEYFLSKEQVDAVGRRIEEIRKKPPKRYNPKVPNEAIDGCESSHIAGSGSNSKTNMDKFDDGGIMALVCRHDIPLFLANIDTPGEQQKYSVALIEHLFNFLPPQATVGVLYDVGCVLDRSLQLYAILPNNVTSRLTFATSAMHAYAHQWACQLVYNPRIRVGLGLTDGEGVERLWSRSRKLIGVTRMSARARRIWLLDRHMASIGEELRADLGSWLRRRQKKGVEGQGKKAQKVLDECGVPLTTLREQWELQQAAQLSIRAHAPVRLKKELDTVLNLQGDLDTVDKAIVITRSTISHSSASRESLQLLSGLETTQKRLKDEVEALYSSLGIEDTFPELQNIDLDFVRTLLMARDLKINIRKRAIGSFFEWDRLDQAAGGREQAIGTKLHQSTRKAISKRKPALMSAIRKFNDYCTTLAMLHKPEWAVPLPEPLPTQLTPLRECPHLMEDVWITPSADKIPPWLEDIDVRQGIRAMLKVDRCLEERRRLGMEGDNMCRWFARELSALEVAIATPTSECFFSTRVPPHTNEIIDSTLLVLLHQHREQLLHMKPSLAGSVLGSTRYDYHEVAARELARRIVDYETPSYTWLLPVTATTTEAFIEDLVDPFKLDPAATNPITAVEAQPDTDATLLGDFLLDYDPEPTDSYEINASLVRIIWDMPKHLIDHRDPSHCLHFQTFAPPAASNIARALYHPTGNIHFTPHDLAIMESPCARLNDICLNGIAKYFHIMTSNPSNPAHFHSQKCALFSTYDLLMTRYNATDDEMWRRTRKVQYWTRDIWILPIHRSRPAEHWVQCTISMKTRELLLFDSFAEAFLWKHEIPEIMRLVTRLVLLANKNGHPLHVVVEEGWTARPVLVQRRQFNGFDCGLFVLANILAVLHGCHVSAISQGEMQDFRERLLTHLLHLPPKF